LNDAKAYFVYRYTVSGKERETSLGPYPELGLAEARIKHAELRKMVRVDLVDPIAEKRAAKTAQPSAAPPSGRWPTSSSPRTNRRGAPANTHGSGSRRSANTRGAAPRHPGP
jgi:hypothetical protein